MSRTRFANVRFTYPLSFVCLLYKKPYIYYNLIRFVFRLKLEKINMGFNDILNKIKHLGFAGTLGMIAVKWKKTERFSGKPTASGMRQIQQIFDKPYLRILVFENHFGYDHIMMQRPQHLLRNLGDEETLVIYNSYYNIDYNDPARIRRITDSVYVMDLYYYRDLVLKCAQEIPAAYLMVYSTDSVPTQRIQTYLSKGFRVIYEYVDDISPDLIAPSKIGRILKRHRFLLSSPAVLTVTTADQLYQHALETADASGIRLISNGAQCSDFRPDCETDDQEYLDWLKPDCIHVGYYGALASWIDYGLLERIAGEDQIQIILIGIEHDDSLKKSGILEHDNVRWFGKKPYDRLPGYVHEFDVCMIPFLVNEITLATSPVKLFEYMAMGKPVVSTALPECMKYQEVQIAFTQKEFVDKLYECRETYHNEEAKQRLLQCAWENDWSAKSRHLKEILADWEKGV